MYFGMIALFQKNDINVIFLEQSIIYHISLSFLDMAAISSAISSEENLM